MNDLTSHAYQICILEDNPADLYIIKQSIQEAVTDCEFTVFQNGADILSHISTPATRVPDLLILDYNVPVVAGASVLNAVRGDVKWSRVSVFVFTGSRDPADAARVKKLGADRYLIKPDDLAGFANLGQTVREWLEARRSQIPS